jgi:hypothetical protein
MHGRPNQAKVFERKQRTYAGPARQTESLYSWLDRSSAWRARRARAWVNGLYEQFPDPQGRLLKELRKDGRRGRAAFYAALASLVLYDRCRSESVHITVDEASQKNGRRIPDLEIVRESDGAHLIVEATALSTQEDWSVSNWNIACAVDALNENLTSADYGISFYPRNVWEREPDLECLLADAAGELRRLEAADHALDGQMIVGQITHESNGCEAELSFYRLNPTYPLQRRRIVGLHMQSGGLSRTSPRLLRKLASKHPNRYGLPESPYVVALFDADEWFEIADVLRMLYGRWDVADIGQHGLSTGFFAHENAATNRGISGVLAVPKFWPLATAGRTTDYVYLPNPFAAHPADLSLLNPTKTLVISMLDDSRCTAELQAFLVKP